MLPTLILTAVATAWLVVAVLGVCVAKLVRDLRRQAAMLRALQREIAAVNYDLQRAKDASALVDLAATDYIGWLEKQK